MPSPVRCCGMMPLMLLLVLSLDAAATGEGTVEGFEVQWCKKSGEEPSESKCLLHCD